MKAITLLLAAGISAVALASAAQAADLIITPEPAYDPIVAPSNSWDGPFVGVFAGYGWGTVYAGDDLVVPSPLDPDDLASPNGWLLGVNAGVNFTLSDGIVAGIVGDIAWADLNDTVLVGNTEVSTKVDWLGSVRGRIGFDGGAFLPYITGGLAFAHNEVSYSTFSDNNTHIGWTVGAGVEFAATENLSVDVLYRYSDYGQQTYTVGSYTGDLGLNSHTLSVGLNFKF
jgi:outer membrane immunogenic protein